MNKNWTVTKKKYLDTEEIRQLRKVCEDASIIAISKNQMLGVRDWAIIDTALSSGLRVSEISNLKEQDLYLGNGMAELIVMHGKGNRMRTVKIDPALKKHLKQYIKWKKSKGKKGDWIFFSSMRDKMSIEAMENIFRKYSRKAGLDNCYTFHSMRHSFAVRLYSITKDLRLVQRMLGHSSPVITQIYADLVEDYINQAFLKPLYAEFSSNE